MTTITLKNCTLRVNNKWRQGQNFTFTLWKWHGISDNPDADEIYTYINCNMSDTILLTKFTKIIIETKSI